MSSQVNISADDGWQSVDAVVVAGHGVASGRKGDPRFPEGTIAMQKPFFAALGLELNGFHMGTVNVSVAPWRYQMLSPWRTFPQVKWHPVEPAEDFSFLQMAILLYGQRYEGLIYYPHPETKPRHFQAPHVLELLLPWIPGLAYGDFLRLESRIGQIEFV